MWRWILEPERRVFLCEPKRNVLRYSVKSKASIPLEMLWISHKSKDLLIIFFCQCLSFLNSSCLFEIYEILNVYTTFDWFLLYSLRSMATVRLHNHFWVRMKHLLKDNTSVFSSTIVEDDGSEEIIFFVFLLHQRCLHRLHHQTLKHNFVFF